MGGDSQVGMDLDPEESKVTQRKPPAEWLAAGATERADSGSKPSSAPGIFVCILLALKKKETEGVLERGHYH